MDRIGVVGASYRTTSIEKLASASLPKDFTDADLVELARLAGFSEMVYLATCNRVEIYFRSLTRLHTNPLLFHLRRSLADLAGGATRLPEDDELYIHFGRSAARHLFRVTAALDSMMVGEAQIAGQVKEAHERAHNADLLGGVLDQTFHDAFHLAKRVRSDTSVARHPVSLVSLVSRRLEQHLESNAGPVLILGAGGMATQALGLVREIDRERPVTLANRSTARARDVVAEDPFATAASLSRTIALPPAACLVIAATSSEETILDLEAVHRLRRQLEPGERLMLIDLALPPNIDVKARELSRVELHGIEEMREESEYNRQLRAAEIDACEQLVEHQLLVFRNHLLNRELSPAAQTLKGSFLEVADKALDRSFSRELKHLDQEDREAVARLVKRLSKKLVQVPVQGLKGAAWNHSSAILENFVKAVNGELDLPFNGKDHS